MKIAVFHNYLDNIGGAEIVSLILARELGADIYTTSIDCDKIKKMGFDCKNIFSIGKIPINAPFRQEFAYWKFRSLNLGKKYDFYIIAGDWAMSGAVHNKPNLWYVHSPTREIWDLYKYTRSNSVAMWQKPIFDIWVMLRRIINRSDVKHVGIFVCNSLNVQRRLKKYLKKDAIVINPPTETSKFYYKKNGSFWLSVNRLLNSKRIDMQIEAFSKIPNEKLIIVGPYEKSRHFVAYAKKCIESKSPNIEIISEITRENLLELYANCKALLTTAQDEDFGMNVVEAMAAGKPVIAPAEGGYLETIINGKTGILIKDISPEKIIQAIKDMSSNLEQYKDACIEQSKKFDTKIFIEKIKNAIS